MFGLALLSFLGSAGQSASQEEQLKQQNFLNQQQILGKLNEKKSDIAITIGVVLLVIGVVYFATRN